MDWETQSFGIIFSTDKKIVKDAMISLMDQMRLFCRSRNLDHIYGMATNLYEWQIVHYNRTAELQKEINYFQMSQIFKLYDRNKQYSYSDLDMKFIMRLI